jgi:hypothetical protein
MKVTYYLEVISSWCYWVEPTWAELQRRYAGRVDFEWKIALMRQEDYPASREQCDDFIVTQNNHCMIRGGLIHSGATTSL